MESKLLTKEQTLERIILYLSQMTDKELRMMLGYARGIVKENQG